MMTVRYAIQHGMYGAEAGEEKRAWKNVNRCPRDAGSRVQSPARDTTRAGCRDSHVRMKERATREAK
jgi:hypothetical protein